MASLSAPEREGLPQDGEAVSVSSARFAVDVIQLIRQHYRHSNGVLAAAALLAETQKTWSVRPHRKSQQRTLNP